jgi:anthranilate synthase component 1
VAVLPDRAAFFYPAEECREAMRERMAFFINTEANAMVYPTRKEFKEKALEGNLIPVYAETFADMDTPVGSFCKLRRGKYNFLLESVEKGTRVGRYSFLGRDPGIVFQARDNQVVIRNGTQVTHMTAADPLAELRKILTAFKPVVDPDLPPFTGGAVGYIGYDTVRRFENIPDKNHDDLGLPDIYFIFTDTIIAFDNVNHKLTVIHNVRIEEGDNLDILYDQAAGVVAQILTDLKKTLPPDNGNSAPAALGTKFSSGFPKAEFKKAVETCRHYIEEGEIIQAVLSQRLVTDFTGDGFSLYRSLRLINPSPYMFYLQFDDLSLIGASPEVHVRSFDRHVTVRPIAGTRPRGRNVEEDLGLEQELLGDDKERAEHLMLVDLARNDIGRVCEFGSVHVSEYMGVERYSHVMHIVSNVEGRLASGRDCFDLIRATFPAGTVSGAPKIRAMEIIDTLEPVRRGPYAGLVGYFSFGGDLDSCITIRTMLVKGNKIYVQVGAGIVADSIPDREYEETLNKAKALFHAIRMAKGGRL